MGFTFLLIPPLHAFPPCCGVLLTSHCRRIENPLQGNQIVTSQKVSGTFLRPAICSLHGQRRASIIHVAFVALLIASVLLLAGACFAGAWKSSVAYSDLTAQFTF